MRRWKLGFALVAVACTQGIIPARSAPESAVRYPAGYSEDIYVGEQQIWPTTSNSTTTSVGPSTSVAPTTATPATTTTVPATTTTSPATTTTVPGGTFTDAFTSLSNWSFAHWRNEKDGNADAASTATVVNGRVQIVAADQNYGDATLRSAVRYNLAVGEFRVQMRDDSGGFPLFGSAYVAFTTLPYNAPSVKRDNGEGPTPQNGVYVQLRDNCRIPWGGPQVSTYTNWVESVATMPCNGGQPTGVVELRVTAGHVELWNGAVKYAEINATIPTTGYIILGVHNHASVKYGYGPTLTGWFDNVSYPAAPSAGPFVSFNAFRTTGPTTVTVNGHVHPFTPHATLSESFAESIPVTASEVLLSSNVITVAGFQAVGNVQLVT